MFKKVVIYTRFSDPKQSEESHEGQERKARQHLEYLKIDHAHAVVLRDSAQRGDLEDRASYEELLSTITRGEVAVLAVDQQSRFSRGFNVRALIQDLVFAGGRFVSAAEGIDTHRVGWQDLVGIKEIHNQMEIRDTGWRVRRQHELRVEKPNGSAGDHPYGYTTEFEDPVAGAAYRGRGPKPGRIVVIDRAAADVVLEVHRKFAEQHQSISSIVRWWEENKDRLPKITKTQLNHQHVRRILSNEKYIGIWTYGRTTTLRDSAGKKKQVAPLPHQRVVTSQRSELRIVPQNLWDKTQARLADLKSVYGLKADGKRRGPSAHYRLLYPKTLIAGLVYCGLCDSRLTVQCGDEITRLGCPKHRVGKCPATTRVPCKVAKAKILKLLGEVLLGYPEWIQTVIAEMRAEVGRLAEVTPVEAETVKHRLSEVDAAIGNLVTAIAAGVDASAVRQRLAKFEDEKHHLQIKLTQLEQMRPAELKMPDDDFVIQELQKLQDLAASDTGSIMPILRAMPGVITAEEIKLLGKRRGYMRLHFTFDWWPAIRHIMGTQVSQNILNLVAPKDHAMKSGEFTIDLGTTPLSQQLRPQIQQWRSEGISWREIARRTNLSRNTLMEAVRRVA